jgi:hypothetical protein
MDIFREIYLVEQLPIFQNWMYNTEAEAKNCQKGDVLLVEDLKTGLVYNKAFRPELMEYDEHYQNEQAVSQQFREHLEMVAAVIERSIGHGSIVEVGCGKGFFLELMLAKGFNITGFDPAYEGSNPRVVRQYFAPGISEPVDGLVLRHVLEHIQDPVRFLQQLSDANGNRGKIYIEVPCFDWICEHRAWFDIFFEHVNYFRLSDFHRMFGHVEESGHIFGGQYLYVVADLSSLRVPAIDLTDRVNFPSDFLSGLEQCTGSADPETPSAVWGGASKGVIFSLLKKRSSQPVKMVIDINPAKQGKFLAATGLKVLAPEKAFSMLPAGATIFVMNSNYLEEIRKMSSDAYNYVAIDHQ